MEHRSFIATEEGTETDMEANDLQRSTTYESETTRRTSQRSVPQSCKEKLHASLRHFLQVV
jgi:hypothetical protein